MAQSPPVPRSQEIVTFAATSIGFAAATLTVNGQQMQTCSGILETASIRFRVVDTTNNPPTATVGSPLSVGQVIKIDGFTALTLFRGIRQTGTSGVIHFTCSR